MVTKSLPHFPINNQNKQQYLQRSHSRIPFHETKLAIVSFADNSARIEYPRHDDSSARKRCERAHWPLNGSLIYTDYSPRRAHQIVGKFGMPYIIFPPTEKPETTRAIKFIALQKRALQVATESCLLILA